MAEYTANINGEVLLPQDRLVDWFVKNPWTDEGGGQCTVTETAASYCAGFARFSHPTLVSDALAGCLMKFCQV